jgi:hypothetical protein
MTNGGWFKSLEIFPFMLRLVEAFFGFFSKIEKTPDPVCDPYPRIGAIDGLISRFRRFHI